MLLTLAENYSPHGAIYLELIDILRGMSRYNSHSVIGRHWRVSDLDVCPYAVGACNGWELWEMFPEYADKGHMDHLIVDGERLMERASLIHQVEVGLFVRIIDIEQPVHVGPGYRLYHGPASFQATNVDLEIRCNEGPYEIVTDDELIVASMMDSFAGTELLT